MSTSLRRSSLLLRLWILSLSTFVITTLVSLFVPSLFSSSPIEALYSRETALRIEQLAIVLDEPALLERQVAWLHEQAELDVWVTAGEQVLAAGTSAAPRGDVRHVVLREAREPRPAVVASYVLGSPPAPPIDGWHLAATLALVALGGLALALILRKLVTRPLLRLATAAETFDAGRLDARVNLPGHDEFAEVARAFDDMAERIEGFVASQRELLANVSHELRTPLARLRVVLDTFEATGELALVTELHEEVDELQSLVESLLEAVSPRAGTDRADLLRGGFGAVDPAALLELAAHRFERSHPERPLACEWARSLPALHANFDGLARALDNVLDNAAKYSAPGSPIHLRAALVRDELEITVTDRGIGIAAADLPYVFEPFFRAERSRSREAGGAGLGLAIVARMIDRHRGRIELASTPQPPEPTSRVEHGTTVRIFLPLAWS